MDIENQILLAECVIIVLATYDCVNGIKESTLVLYKVKVVDTLYNIANTMFRGIVTLDQLKHMVTQ